MSTAGEAIAHTGANYLKKTFIVGAAAGGIAVAAYSGVKLIEAGIDDGLHGLEHEVPALIDSGAKDVGHIFTGAAALITSGHISSPWHHPVAIPKQNQVETIQWPKLAGEVSTGGLYSAKSDASKTSHTWGWDVIYNNTLKHGNHEDAGIGVREGVDITIPGTAIVSSRLYKLADPTNATKQGLVVRLNADKLTTQRTNPRIAVEKKCAKKEVKVKTYGTVEKKVCMYIKEVSSGDGWLTRSENVVTDNSNDGPRTAKLEDLVEELGQRDTVNLIGHDQRLMQATAATELKDDLETGTSIIPNEGSNDKLLKKEVAALGKLPLKVIWVNSRDQPINLKSKVYPNPIGMPNRPIQEYARAIGYQPGDVNVLMKAQTTFSGPAAQVAASATEKYTDQEKG
jgi:hypothetical protein